MVEQKKSDIKCNYCDKNSFYIFHRNKKHEVDWAICIDCLKKVCSNILGKGKNGGRVST